MCPPPTTPRQLHMTVLRDDMAGTGSPPVPGQAATLDAEPSAVLDRTDGRLWDDDHPFAKRRTGIGRSVRFRLAGSSPSSVPPVTTVCHADDDLSSLSTLDRMEHAVS